MARIANRLTKEMLQEYGILDALWDSENNKWIVLRKWYPVCCSRSLRTENNKVITELQEKKVYSKHKYGKDKVYYAYIFSYNNRSISIPVARLVLAWTKGEIPEGYDACHGKGGELDNNPDNIWIDTHANNIKQRNIDYQLNCFNQWKNSR